MAILTLGVSANSPADLTAAINAALATLLTDTIIGVQILVGDLGQVSRVEFGAIITYQDGQSAIATPFTATVLTARTASEIASLATGLIAGAPGNFWSFTFANYANPDGRKTEPFVAILFTNVTASAADHWAVGGTGSGGSSTPSGPATGDLGGSYPGPIVVGFQGVPISSATPQSGATWVYDANTNTWMIADPIRYFASSAAAVAASPFINGTFVGISPGSPPTEAGLYQVTSNGGASFPADYTLVSSSVVTASQVSIIDAAGWYPGAGNVENALAEIGAGFSGQLSGVIPAAPTAIDAIAIAQYGDVEWELELVKGGNTRYSTLVRANNDGAAAVNHTESCVTLTPGTGTFDFTITTAISGGNMQLIITPSTTGWAYRLRRRLLNV